MPGMPDLLNRVSPRRSPVDRPFFRKERARATVGPEMWEAAFPSSRD
jgi:hypothetical protein